MILEVVVVPDDPKTQPGRALAAPLPAPKRRAMTVGDHNDNRSYVPPRRTLGVTRAPIVLSNGVPTPAWNDDATGQYQTGAIDEAELAARRDERPEKLRTAHLEERIDVLVDELIARDKARRAFAMKALTYAGTFLTGAGGTAIVVALTRGC